MNIKKIKEIKEYKKRGLCYARLAKKFHESEDKIKKIKGIKGCRPDKVFDGIGDNPELIPLFIRQNLAKQKEELPEERIKRNVCVICGAKKEEKFRLTHICSLNCYGGLTTY